MRKFQERGWYFIVKPTCSPVPRARFTAGAKREPFITDGDFVREPGDLWFEFGPTEDAVLAKLQSEVFRLSAH